MDNFTGMAVFARVVEANSFTEAARRLGMSKAAVSKQVSKLEERLGARLLNRTTRRLSLTEVGAAFYERCARIVAEAEEAELAVTRLNATPRGTLRIDAPVNFGMQYLAPLLPPFMLQHPDLRVDMSFNDRFVDLVEEGCDLAVRIGQLPDSSLVARKLAETRSVICAAPSYWDRHGRPGDPSDLANHDCFAYSYLATGSEWRLQGPGGEVAVRVSGSLAANNGDVLRQAAVAGLGVVAMPVFIVCDDLRKGRL
ncbi:MAG: LysR family transcriptional regulator, partial [Alphaproteobacteria bacterium]|nr:LysR family transcriptional regulator [Alphaproteobacteria bacterium]